MFPPQIYSIIYMIVLVLGCAYCVIKLAFIKDSDKVGITPYNDMGLKAMVFILIILIGTRPASPLFADMMFYVNNWGIYGPSYKFTLLTENFIFDNIYYSLPNLGLSWRFFMILCATFSLGGTYIAIKKIFKDNVVWAYITFLTAFSTFFYLTNGIKAGVASAAFLLAIAYKDNRKLCILFVILSLGLHHSMIVPCIAFLVCYFYNNPKVFLLIWIACLVCALFKITYFQELFSTMSDEKTAGYLSGELDALYMDKGGLRIDFILYSVFPIIISWIAIKKYNFHDERFIFTLNVYTLTNAVWLLCMYASFTNRIAYLSWLIYPILLMYPFLNGVSPQRRSFLYPLFIGHLLFTFLIFYKTFWA